MATTEVATPLSSPLSPEELRRMDAYWRGLQLSRGRHDLSSRQSPAPRAAQAGALQESAAGSLGIGSRPIAGLGAPEPADQKVRLECDVHLGPGHGAPATLANCYLEGYYSEIYPDKSRDEAGMLKFFRQFSFPGGIGSHCTPETPGSIHEGGELGYSLSHGYGAAFDNPDLIVTVVVGDGEAETGPLATSWHSNKFLNPIRDGAVLPVLHLNGYKIANPTILARIPHDELEALLTGYGHKPYFVEGNDPFAMHQKMASTLEQCILEIRAHPATCPFDRRYRAAALAHDRASFAERMDSDQKKWTATRWKISGARIRFPCSTRPRISPISKSSKTGCAATSRKNSSTPRERWCRNCRNLRPRVRAASPPTRTQTVDLLRKELELPDFRDYAVKVKAPGASLCSTHRRARTLSCRGDAPQHEFVPRFRSG